MLSAYGAARNILEWATLRLPGIYVVAALLVCTALCVLTPPFGVPDESGHARRAMGIGYGELVAKKTTAGVGGPVDVNFLALAVRMDAIRDRFTALHLKEKRLPDGRLTVGELVSLQRVSWAHRRVFSDFRNIAVYSPVLYLPQAMGWRVSEAAELTIVRSLMLSRLCAAWCAIGVGWLALRLCRERWLLFVCFLLPTELSLMSSDSQDALLMPVAGLVTVLLWRAVGMRRMLTHVELVVVACLTAICVTARVPYLPLTLALMLPALEVEEGGWRRLVPSALGMALAVALVGAWQMAVHSLGTSVGPEARPALQVAFLQAHPLAGARSLLDAVFWQIPMSLAKGTYLLGTNDVVPAVHVRLMLIAGAGSIVLLNLRTGLRSWAGRSVLGIALLGTISAIWLAEYVIWTPPGAVHVIGLQTRYFLPLLPFVFLLFPERLGAAVKRRLGWGGLVRARALLVGAGIFCAAVMYAPWTAAHVFYRTGLIDALSLVLGR